MTRSSLFYWILIVSLMMLPLDFVVRTFFYMILTFSLLLCSLYGQIKCMRCPKVQDTESTMERAPLVLLSILYPKNIYIYTICMRTCSILSTSSCDLVFFIRVIILLANEVKPHHSSFLTRDMHTGYTLSRLLDGNAKSMPCRLCVRQRRTCCVVEAMP